MPTIRGLTQDDANLLQELLDDARRRRRNTEGRAAVEPEREHQAPEVYVARTPSDGLPPLIGFEPGVATCDVYRLLPKGQQPQKTPLLVPRPHKTENVYNLSSEEIGGNRWVAIQRDKDGNWLLSGGGPSPSPGETDTTPGSGTGTGSLDNPPDVVPGTCKLAALQHTDCLLAKGPLNTTVLEYNGTDGSWESTGDLYYFDTHGVLSFWFADGQLHASLGGMELLHCGDGCFRGGPLTGHGGGLSACNARTFEVCFSCVDCMGTGTGPSFWTGTGSPDIPLCVDLAGEDLVAFWIHGPDCLTSMPAFPFTWGGSDWSTGSFAPCTSTNNPLTLTCTGAGSWLITPTTAGATACFDSPFTPLAPYAGNSDPMAPELRFIFDVNASCGGPSRAELLIMKAP